MAHSPSDLTAHILGEPLPPEIRQEVENSLARDPATRAEAAATRELEAQLRAAFAADLSQTATPRPASTRKVSPQPSRIVRSRPIRRPGYPTWLYASLGTAALVSLSVLLFTAIRPVSVTVSSTHSVEDLRISLAKSELPSPEKIRVGELVAYFSAPVQTSRKPKFELASAPWNPRHHLLRLSAASAQSFEVSLAPGQVESFRVLTSEDLPRGSELLLAEGITLCEIVPTPLSANGEVLLSLKGRNPSESLTIANSPVEFAHASPEMRLTTAVTAYGLLLKNSEKAPLSLPLIQKVAEDLPAQNSLKNKEFFKMLEDSQPLMR